MYEYIKKLFIQADTPFVEGEVNVFEQKIQAENVEKATLTITALGIYEAQINGEKVGDIMFAPGYTYYPRELQVQEYDVTRMLKKGDNLLRIYLGQGWYCGRYTYNNICRIYGEHSAVAWELRVDDGQRISTVTSRDTVSMAISPYDYAGLYDGEIYHAERMGRSIGKPIPYNGKLPDVLDENIIYTKIQEELPVKEIVRREDTTILDFGQNFTGFLEINPQKMQGTMLRLRHGELLNSDGSLYTVNLRRAKAEIVYYKGKDTALYRPKFTFMGFRYAELSGVPYKDGLVRAYVVGSQMHRTGRFSCENKKVEKLYENQVWGQRGNYLEVPTDCPQRDERMGYTGDAHVFALTGAFNYNTEEFLAKFLRDIRYTQMDNTEGYVSPVVPGTGPDGIGKLPLLGWGNAVTILPWIMWKQFGQDCYLRQQYGSMKAHVECEIRHMGQKEGRNLWLGPNLGDWLMLEKDSKYTIEHSGPVSNSFIINDLRIMKKTAEHFGKKEDEERYRRQLENSIAAYVNTFVNPDGSMKDDYQGAYVMALALVLPRGGLWEKVFRRLVEKLRRDGVQTGFFSTKHLLPLLAENGEAELAYDLFLQEEKPGWMYQVVRGATTIWERWDALRPDGTVNESETESGANMVSFNHYAFGSVGEFYYTCILGIQPLEPGYKKIRIHPYIEKRLDSVRGYYESSAGKIEVSWHTEEKGWSIQIVTPAETDIILPNGKKQCVSAGKYTFKGKGVCAS